MNFRKEQSVVFVKENFVMIDQRTYTIETTTLFHCLSISLSTIHKWKSLKFKFRYSKWTFARYKNDSSIMPEQHHIFATEFG